MENYEIVNVKKTFMGTVDVRDYIVEKCLKNNRSVKVILRSKDENGEMILSPERLKHPDDISEPKTSKFNGQKYRLKMYKWRPENKNQPKLF